MKTAVAATSIEVNTYCPYCDTINNIFTGDSYDLIREEFTHRGEMRSDDCEIEVECDTCQEHFLITSIEF